MRDRSKLAEAVLDAALKAGASRDEIAEALGVGFALNAGAAPVYSTVRSRPSKPILDRSSNAKATELVLRGALTRRHALQHAWEEPDGTRLGVWCPRQRRGRTWREVGFGA
jgi:hypothetical protein